MKDKDDSLYLKKIPKNKTQLWELILELKKNKLLKEKLLSYPLENGRVGISKVYYANFDYFKKRKIIDGVGIGHGP